MQDKIIIDVKANDNVTIPLKNIESSIIRFVGAISASIAVFRAITFPVKAATDFQTELLNVQKTTNYADEGIVLLGKDLVNLSKTVNVTAVDLAKIAAVAGQMGLGSQGRDALLGFTESAARFASVLDVSAEEAANGISKILNIFRISLLETEKISSALNEVSNQSTASGRDLLDVIMRIGDAAGSLTLVGSSALAATGVDMGLTLETIGTSFSKIFSNMQAEADKFAKFMGMSTDEWSNKVQSDGIGALKTFLAALRKEGPASRAAIIEELSGGGRISALVNKLVNDYSNQVLNKNLAAAALGFTSGTSAINEQKTVMKGLQAQYQILKNSITAIAIEIGGKALPGITVLVRRLQNFFENPNTLNGFQRLADDIMKVGDAVVDTASVLASLNISFANLIRVAEIFIGLKIASKIAEIGAGMSSMRAAAGPGIITKLLGNPADFTKVSDVTKSGLNAYSTSYLAARVAMQRQSQKIDELGAAREIALLNETDARKRANIKAAYSRYAAQSQAYWNAEIARARSGITGQTNALVGGLAVMQARTAAVLGATAAGFGAFAATIKSAAITISAAVGAALSVLLRFAAIAGAVIVVLDLVGALDKLAEAFPKLANLLGIQTDRQKAAAQATEEHTLKLRQQKQATDELIKAAQERVSNMDITPESDPLTRLKRAGGDKGETQAIVKDALQIGADVETLKTAQSRESADLIRRRTEALNREKEATAQLKIETEKLAKMEQLAAVYRGNRQDKKAIDSIEEQRKKIAALTQEIAANAKLAKSIDAERIASAAKLSKSLGALDEGFKRLLSAAQTPGLTKALETIIVPMIDARERAAALTKQIEELDNKSTGNNSRQVALKRAQLEMQVQDANKALRDLEDSLKAFLRANAGTLSSVVIAEIQTFNRAMAQQSLVFLKANEAAGKGTGELANYKTTEPTAKTSIKPDKQVGRSSVNYEESLDKLQVRIRAAREEKNLQNLRSQLSAEAEVREGAYRREEKSFGEYQARRLADIDQLYSNEALIIKKKLDEQLAIKNNPKYSRRYRLQAELKFTELDGQLADLEFKRKQERAAVTNDIKGQYRDLRREVEDQEVSLLEKRGELAKAGMEKLALDYRRGLIKIAADIKYAESAIETAQNDLSKATDTAVRDKLQEKIDKLKESLELYQKAAISLENNYIADVKNQDVAGQKTIADRNMSLAQAQLELQRRNIAAQQAAGTATTIEVQQRQNAAIAENIRLIEAQILKYEQLRAQSNNTETRAAFSLDIANMKAEIAGLRSSVITAGTELRNSFSSNLEGALNSIISRSATFKDAMLNMVRGVFNDASAKIAKNWAEQITKSIAGATGGGDGIFGVIGDILFPNSNNPTGKKGDPISVSVENGLPGLGAVSGAKAGDKKGGFFQGIVDFFTPKKTDPLSGVKMKPGQQFDMLNQQLAGFGEDAINSVKTGVEAGANSLKAAASSGGLGIGNFFSSFSDAISGFFKNLGGSGSGGGGWISSLISIFGSLFGFADGGKVSGPGTGTSDSIVARLSDGEYVMTAEKTKRYLPILEAMRTGKFDAFMSGMMNSSVRVPSYPRFADGGLVSAAAMGTNVSVSVDARGTAVAGDPDKSKQLGRAIESAVKQELAKQKRFGGLLSGG